jgi:hypothetical protein
LIIEIKVKVVFLVLLRIHAEVEVFRLLVVKPRTKVEIVFSLWFGLVRFLLAFSLGLLYPSLFFFLGGLFAPFNSLPYRLIFIKLSTCKVWISSRPVPVFSSTFGMLV